jgi:hypothetical protein
MLKCENSPLSERQFRVVINLTHCFIVVMLYII